ncbi:MAG: hypothetical protein AB1547_13035 [Thermodesulfobacteriota bacterium]
METSSDSLKTHQHVARLFISDALAKSQEVYVASRDDWGTFFAAAKKVPQPPRLCPAFTKSTGKATFCGLIISNLFDTDDQGKDRQDQVAIPNLILTSSRFIQ